MSFGTALQVVGFLAVGVLLLLGLLAMGPIGWLVFVPMLLIGAYQVHRERREQPGQRGSDAAAELNYCPNCGSAIDVDAFAEADTATGPDGDLNENKDDQAVRYCSTCGASLESLVSSDRPDERSGSGRSATVTNCPDCGAPNDPERTSCKHCGAEL